MKKKLFCLILCLVMALSVLQGIAAADTNPEETETASEPGAETKEEIKAKLSEQMKFGYIPAKIPGSRTISEAYANGDMETYYRLAPELNRRDTLPARYDSRSYGYVTSVKNQNPYGSCWAHAAMACIESYMIKHGVPVGSGAAATTSLNLSETQHCFFTYSDAYDAEGLLTGDKSKAEQYSCLDQGGNGVLSAYTLQRWTGAASESTAALAYSKAGTVETSGLDSRYAYDSNICHVQNSVWIPSGNIDAVKRAIMEYGAGNISYYQGDDGYIDYDAYNYYSYICTIDTSSQDYYFHKWANHAITVVGWDDTIPASYFHPDQPKKPGAWICKNSWSDYMFDGGYCYISYEDTSVLEDSIYFYDAEPVDNYDHNYQYDGTDNVIDGYYIDSDTKIANVFTANGTEDLAAVAFCTYDEAVSYTVEIYKNPAVGDLSSGERMTTQSGSLTFPGYYTVKLDDPVALSAGDTFAVVVSLTCPEGNCVVPYDRTNSIGWTSWEHADHGNTSYVLWYDTWYDCPNNGDFRIKAYTVDASGTPEEPVAINGTVVWNEADVQYKGTTPYVIANGKAQTPRFTVKNSADGSVINPGYYNFEYKENTRAGTGYVFVTFKGAYTGSCRGSFKIYLPATKTTTVENVSNGIKIKWSPVDGAAGYVIYRRAWNQVDDGWTEFVRWNNVTALEWIDGSDASHKVYAGTRYQYGIKAYFARRLDPIANVEIGGNVGDNFNLGEVGPLKTTVRITTRELKSVTAGSKQMTVKWAPSKNFTGYQIKYATDAGFTKNVKAIKINDPKAAQTVITGLASGTTYYVTIRSYHEFNGMTYFGEWSNVLSCKVR
ncbi:MAG: fibronectin type III domain-containing protein [Clostridia bacterium]|nr:fibronectin type III domain-containing protein [Clostridia bacterium]